MSAEYPSSYWLAATASSIERKWVRQPARHSATGPIQSRGGSSRSVREAPALADAIRELLGAPHFQCGFVIEEIGVGAVSRRAASKLVTIARSAFPEYVQAAAIDRFFVVHLVAL